MPYPVAADVYSPAPIVYEQPSGGSDPLRIVGLLAIPVAAFALLAMALGRK